MKSINKVVILLFTALFLASCSGVKGPAIYTMGQSTSTGCETQEPGEVGACKVEGSISATAVPTQFDSSQVILPPTMPRKILPTQIATLEASKTVEPKIAQPYPTQSDAQGAITVDITPENLDQPGDQVIVDVSMDTHSVNLSMDLAKLASLSTDTGKKVRAILWDAPRGGHHVQGKLSFPTIVDGKNIFDQANSMTITIIDVDAKSRVFTWQLTP